MVTNCDEAEEDVKIQMLEATQLLFNFIEYGKLGRYRLLRSIEFLEIMAVISLYIYRCKTWFTKRITRDLQTFVNRLRKIF